MSKRNTLAHITASATLALSAGPALAEQAPVNPGDLPTAVTPGAPDQPLVGIASTSSTRNAPLFIPKSEINRAYMEDPNSTFNRIVSLAVRQAVSADRRGADSIRITITPHELASNKQVRSGKIGSNKQTKLVHESIEALAQERGIDPDVSEPFTRRVSFAKDPRFTSAIRGIGPLPNKLTDGTVKTREIFGALNDDRPVIALRGINRQLDGLPYAARNNFSGVEVGVSYVFDGDPLPAPGVNPAVGPDGLPVGVIQPITPTEK